MTKKMSRQEEHEFYADPENQTPLGPADDAAPGSPKWSPCDSRPTSSTKSAGVPATTTDPSPAGSAGR